MGVFSLEGTQFQIGLITEKPKGTSSFRWFPYFETLPYQLEETRFCPLFPRVQQEHVGPIAGKALTSPQHNSILFGLTDFPFRLRVPFVNLGEKARFVRGFKPNGVAKLV